MERAPRSQRAAWDRYWAGIQKTGLQGQVLWDADSDQEREAIMARLKWADLSLPLIDVGCGSGRYTRALKRLAPRVLGIDASAAALTLARAGSETSSDLEFRLVDIAQPGGGEALAAEIGEANVHIRGVLHVLDQAERQIAAENLRHLLGDRGVLVLSETNIASPLDHLEFQGATATSMPDPLLRCIEAGIRPPARFGDAELHATFAADAWENLDSGETTMHGVPLHEGREIEDIPSYFAVLRRRRL